MKALRQALTSLFNIRLGEGRMTGLLFIHSFCLGAATVSFSTAANALFLAAFDVGMLPYVYIGSAGMAVLIGLLYTRLQVRLPFPTLLVMTLVFLLVTIAAFRLGLAIVDSKWIVFGLLFWLRLVIVLVNLEFWGLAGRLFNVRQGKRLFTLIGAGELIANILGGFATPAFVMLFGTPNLLLVSVLGLMMALGTLCLTKQLYSEQLTAMPDAPTSRQKPVANRLVESLQQSYTRWIILSNALMIVVYSFVDFTFYAYTQSRYQDEVHLAMFIGPFFAAVQIINVLTKTFVSSRLFNRFGLQFGLLLHPALLIGLSLCIATTHTVFGAVGVLFWLVALMKLCDEVLWTSIYDPSLLILYQPLPAEPRRATQVAVQSIFGPIAIGLSGGALLVLGSQEMFILTSAQLTMVIPILLIAAIVAARQLYREYPNTLTQALAKRTLGDVDFSLQDGPSLAVVQQKLHSSNPLEIQYALELLEQSEHDSLSTSLVSLLEHPDDEIRFDVLQRLERSRASDAYEAVARHLTIELSPGVKAAALQSLCALGESEVIEVVSPYLDDPRDELRQAAMIGLLRDGGIAGVLAAGERLMIATRSPQRSQRVNAAWILGEVGLASFYQPLLSLLKDTDPMVCQAALAAAVKIRHPKLWPMVMTHITSTDLSASVKNAASSALEAGGLPALSHVETALSQDGWNRDTRQRLVRIAGHIGGEQAIEMLRSALSDPDPLVRLSVLDALSKCGYQARSSDQPHILNQVEVEGAEATWLLAALVDIGPAEAVALLRESLLQNLHQLTRRLFLLVSFVSDEQAVRRAWDALSHPIAEKRAYALEIVDVLVALELKTILLPLIEELSPAERLQRLEGRFPQRRLERGSRLQDILSQPDPRVSPWTKACTLYSLAKLSTQLSAAELDSALTSPEPLVHETARWVVATVTQGNKGPLMALTPIEKVIILKTVRIFVETPDEVLAEVATLLEEVDFSAGEVIFEKGEIGSCMYVIVEGQVRVHDGDRTLTHLDGRQMFGELAVLDSEPRSATVTAVEPTRLFCLNQEAFYDLMTDRIEIARGIIRALCQDLRSRTTGPP